jgi:parvulin-like peptidyl-prolyl isomerase
VSDADVQKYYNDNKAQYQQPESRDVRYILVGKSKATAQSVYQQLVKGGDKAWCTLAKKYSKDASGQNCGKATFSKGQTVAIFDKTAFSAPANKVVKPFYDPTQYKAWFVVEPLGPVKPKSTTPEKQVASQIRTTLLGTKQKAAVADFSSSLTKSYCHGSKIKYQVGYTPQQDACTATTTNNTTTQ